jgi:hypothetical protein
MRNALNLAVMVRSIIHGDRGLVGPQKGSTMVVIETIVIMWLGFMIFSSMGE